MSTRRFLNVLFETVTIGLIEVRALPSKRRTWATPGAWDTLGAFLTREVNQREICYVGVCTRQDTTSGTTANLAQLPAVWIDFDIPPGDVRTRLARFPIPPTLIVESGLGAHVYWRLREPLDVQDPTGLSQAASVLRRLAGAFGGDDRACDPARVLRLPGTKNWKYDAPRDVTLVHDHDADVNLSELADLLPAEVVRKNRLVVESSIAPGARNDSLYRLARKLRSTGVATGTIAQTIEQVNRTQCDPPLPDDEVFTLLRHAVTQADAPTFDPVSPITIVHDASPSDVPAHGAVFVNLAAVVPEPVDWLWPGWLPRRKGVVLAGDPGTGKSMVSIDLAARLSRGGVWPTGEPAPRGRVLLLVAEDGLADTVRPRLDAAGGDASQVDVLTGVRETAGDGLVNLARDVHVLEQMLQQTQPALVIVDPLNAYLGDTDSYKDAAVRGLLTPLLALVDRHRCVLLWIAHLTKSSERRALYRPGASIAFVAAARVVLVVGGHPDEPKTSVVCQGKNNLAPLATSLAYRVTTGAVEWAGPVSCTADGILQDTTPTAAGPAHTLIAELRDAAADGCIDVDRALVQAELLGIPRRTLQYAARRV